METHTSVIIFDVLVYLSVLLTVCTLLPALFSKTVERSSGWYSLVTGLLLYSLSYGLIIGRQKGPHEPPPGLCVTQTLLIYAVPALSVHSISLAYPLILDVI